MQRSKEFGGFPTPGQVTISADTVMDKLFFLTESQWETAKNESKYDFIIIGSSFCALAVAKQALMKDPSCRILIIERGPFFLPTHFQNLGKPFDQTLVTGYLETFPWTMSAETAEGKAGTVRYQHGMIPYVGGRSVMWSAWCPRPTANEMHEWPEETIKAAQAHFESAEKLLHVEKADDIEDKSIHAIYGALQNQIQQQLQVLDGMETPVEGIEYTGAAPMAVDGRYSGIPFAKYSVPAELLQLATKQAKLKDRPDLDIVTNCIVDKIIQQNGTATALKTSRGVIALGDAKLILAMGTLPPTTLVRNSFPEIVSIQENAGKRFGAHFISSIIARVKREDVFKSVKPNDLEIGAFYIAGIGKDETQQFHIQLTAISDKNPIKNAEEALRYMPDVVATASKQQLLTSEDYVVFVCAVLGELDVTNPDSWFYRNQDSTDLTTNSKLQVTINDSDRETWDAMDNATFGVLEKVLGAQSTQGVEYWHGDPDKGHWTTQRPSEKQRRYDMLVHECATLHIGEEREALVDTKYLLRGTTNVYVTGGGLWPRAGSWNPTLTMVALAQHLADNLVQEKQNQM